MQYLAILKVQPGVPPEQLGALIQVEAAQVWQLQTAGIIRSIHYIEGPVGAVLMLEAADRQQAEQHVRQLPMVASELLSVEILPLTPYTGLAALFATSSH